MSCKNEMDQIRTFSYKDASYIFSVVATVFLPLGFLTGLLGVNVGGVPGLENDNGFWVFVGLCALIVVVQVALFKKLKWF